MTREQDYLLWNRLGSSLSNGNKPEEALGAYREALSLRPTYTRAIYNVGVACECVPLENMSMLISDSGLNIGAFKEAAEHFLSAISLQENSPGDSSHQLWYTLRRALQSMVGLLCLNASHDPSHLSLGTPRPRRSGSTRKKD